MIFMYFIHGVMFSTGRSVLYKVQILLNCNNKNSFVYIYKYNEQSIKNYIVISFLHLTMKHIKSATQLKTQRWKLIKHFRQPVGYLPPKCIPFTLPLWIMCSPANTLLYGGAAALLSPINAFMSRIQEVPPTGTSMANLLSIIILRLLQPLPSLFFMKLRIHLHLLKLSSPILFRKCIAISMNWRPMMPPLFPVPVISFRWNPIPSGILWAVLHLSNIIIIRTHTMFRNRMFFMFWLLAVMFFFVWGFILLLLCFNLINKIMMVRYIVFITQDTLLGYFRWYGVEKGHSRLSP